MPHVMVDYRYFSCWSCGIPFALTKAYVDAITEGNKTFYCPNKCALGFGKSEADKVREQLEREVERRQRANRRADENYELAQSLERSRSALRGQVTKIKKRIGRGVCPCCNRHFVNVERHMKSKHPDFHEGATCA